MERLDEQELDHLLRQWDAPPAPADLADLRTQGAPWWRWLLTGTIRIPAPVGLAALVLIGAWIYVSLAPARPNTTPAEGVSLADFQQCAKSSHGWSEN